MVARRWTLALLSTAALVAGLLALPPGWRSAGAAEQPVETVVSGAGGVVWSVAFAPDGRFFYSIRQTGEIFAGRLGTTPVKVATLPSCPDCGEGGLMGLATSPAFDRDGLLYAMYTYRTADAIANRVVRLKVAGNVAGVQGTVLDGLPGSTTHDGGRLRFGPDGMLYAAIGDTRAQPNPAQDKTRLGGKILRLNPAGGAAAGNPFGNAVWSYGHRNPQGLAFRADGTLFALEHGPGCRDELNRIVAGGNFGWTGDEGCPPAFPAGSIAPVKLYTETSTIAPSGATFYTSTAIPQWTGSLLFTSLKDQTLYRVTLAQDGRSVTGEEQLYRGQFGRLRDVEQAPDGALWLTTDDGRLLRVQRVQAPAPTASPTPAGSSPPSPAVSPSPGCPSPPRTTLATDTINATGNAPVTVTGQPGAVVELLAYTRPSTTYRVVRTLTVGADGTATAAVRPPANTRLLARQQGCAAGPSVVLNVRTTLSLTAVRNGQRSYTFAGDSLPARTGGLIVSLYRLTADGSQVLAGQTRADAATGQWRLDRRFTGEGRFGFLVRTGQDLQNAPGQSNVRSTLVY